MQYLAREQLEKETATVKKELYLSLDSVTKKFGENTAVDKVNLNINDGEFVVFLGPSGCGKTTLLRLIAGLESLTHGTIIQKGVNVSELPPVERDFGIVFQSYALFPNLTVNENIAYGLVNLKVNRKSRDARVKELLSLVGLPDLGDKYPNQLSGGQQQRVALARALATSPSLLLLDEPLSALDASVRVFLKNEIKALQRKLGVTTIMVTHDQEEALSIADKIVIMKDGEIIQVGTPHDIYYNPVNIFVAEFVGSANVFVASTNTQGKIQLPELGISLAPADFKAPTDNNYFIAFRAENIKINNVENHSINTSSLKCVVEHMEFFGPFVRLELSPQNQGGDKKKFFVNITNEELVNFCLQIGSEVIASFNPNDLIVLRDTK